MIFLLTFNKEIDLTAYQPGGKPSVVLIFTRPDDSYTTLRIDVLATLADNTLPANTYIVSTNVQNNRNCFLVRYARPVGDFSQTLRNLESRSGAII